MDFDSDPLRHSASASQTDTEAPASTGYFVLALCVVLVLCGLFAIGVFPNPFG